MELKTIKFTETNSQGKKFNFTLHKFPIYTKDEIEELKKNKSKVISNVVSLLKLNQLIFINAKNLVVTNKVLIFAMLIEIRIFSLNI